MGKFSLLAGQNPCDPFEVAAVYLTGEEPVPRNRDCAFGRRLGSVRRVWVNEVGYGSRGHPGQESEYRQKQCY